VRCFMTSISRINASALLLIKQANAQTAQSQPQKAASSTLIAIAHGQTDQTTGAAAQTQDAAKDSLLNLTKFKLDLYERTGQALGVKMDDYTDPTKYAAALRAAVIAIQIHNPQGWRLIVNDIEEKLGLHKLGVSLDDVIGSIANPAGASDQKLNEAWKHQLANYGAGDDGTAAHPADNTYGIGLYLPIKV
jgi:hypothetical protein